MHVVTTQGETESGGGNSKFGNTLNGLRANRRGFTLIRDVLIVSDNDDSQENSFQAICNQLSGSGFAPPPAPLERSTGNPRITIMMLPLEDEPGHLESVCVPAARSVYHPTTTAIDYFAAMLRADEWEVRRKAKFWLRVALAAGCEKDPFVYLSKVFSDPKLNGLIPLGHNSLDPIADVLSSFRG